jgi:hypothetical protein
MAWASPVSPTCPPSGPSSTGFLTFLLINSRFEPGLCEPSLRFRETGFCGQRPTRQKGAQSLKFSSTETKRTRGTPPNRGNAQRAGKSPLARACVVEARGLELRARHVVLIEPVSGSLDPGRLGLALLKPAKRTSWKPNARSAYGPGRDMIAHSVAHFLSNRGHWTRRNEVYSGRLTTRVLFSDDNVSAASTLCDRSDGSKT